MFTPAGKNWSNAQLHSLRATPESGQLRDSLTPALSGRDKEGQREGWTAEWYRDLLPALCCSGDIITQPAHLCYIVLFSFWLKSAGWVPLGSEPRRRKYDSEQCWLSTLQFIELDRLILTTGLCRRLGREDIPHSTDEEAAALEDLPEPVWQGLDSHLRTDSWLQCRCSFCKPRSCCKKVALCPAGSAGRVCNSRSRGCEFELHTGLRGNLNKT